MGHSYDGYDLASTLSTLYDLRKGDLFVLELGTGSTSGGRKYLFRHANVRWRYAKYFVDNC